MARKPRVTIPDLIERKKIAAVSAYDMLRDRFRRLSRSKDYPTPEVHMRELTAGISDENLAIAAIKRERWQLLVGTLILDAAFAAGGRFLEGLGLAARLYGGVASLLILGFAVAATIIHAGFRDDLHAHRAALKTMSELRDEMTHLRNAVENQIAEREPWLRSYLDPAVGEGAGPYSAWFFLADWTAAVLSVALILVPALLLG